MNATEAEGAAEAAGPDLFACGRLRVDPATGLAGYWVSPREREAARLAEERERARRQARRAADLRLGEAFADRRRREITEAATRAERRARRAAELQLGGFRKAPEPGRRSRAGV